MKIKELREDKRFKVIGEGKNGLNIIPETKKGRELLDEYFQSKKDGIISMSAEYKEK